MNGFLKAVVLIGLVVWAFLLWESFVNKQPDDGSISDRCAELREGGGGFFQKLVRGCL